MRKIKLQAVLSFLFICLSFQVSFAQGARYKGNYTKSAPLKYVGKSNFTIEGVEITNANDHNIILQNCENVVIKNSKFSSSPLKKGIYIYNSKNVTINDCTFENVQGGLLVENSQGIKFEYNDLKNIVGTLRGAAGVGNIAQFVRVSGAGNSISFNANENMSGESAPEDLINLFESNGTASSPIQVMGNWIRGGGPSASGGGIILGDHGGSYQIAADNILVDVGQYGVAIAGGNNMTLRNNKVFGSRKPFTNIGIYGCNWYPNQGASHSITIEKNVVNYTNKDGVVNPFWFDGSMGTIKGKDTNVYDAKMTASILPAQILGRGTGNPPTTTPTPPVENPGDTNKPNQPNNPGNNNPNTGGPNAGQDDNTNSTDIVIYVDSYNRICINTPGRIYRLASMTAYLPNGQKIYTQPIIGYHTVINEYAPAGTYKITVRNGLKVQSKEITIVR